jgi:hypothetical protein
MKKFLMSVLFWTCMIGALVLFVGFLTDWTFQSYTDRRLQYLEHKIDSLQSVNK